MTAAVRLWPTPVITRYAVPGGRFDGCSTRQRIPRGCVAARGMTGRACANLGAPLRDRSSGTERLWYRGGDSVDRFQLGPQRMHLGRT